MNISKKIKSGFNIFQQARDLGVPVWQTPTVLSAFMGLVITVLMFTVLVVMRSNNDDPGILVIAEAIVVITVFSIGGSMISSFEHVAKSNKMKSDFIAIASHQMKTPLTRMKWLLSYWEQSVDHSAQKSADFVRKMRLANEKMIHMTNYLMDAARIDRGEVIVQIEKVDFKSILIDVLNEYDGLVKQKNIILCLDIAIEDVEVRGDKKRIHTILNNLISNAIKYSPEGERIYVVLTKKSDTYIFVVKDHGIGIPEEQQEFVFEKFFRGKNALKSGVEGTGLGLFLTREIIRQLGGDITFRSIENVGTEFTASFLDSKQ